MNILDKIKLMKPKAPRITVYGKPGIGKSSLAASFPEPLFLLTEQCGLSGITAIDVPESFSHMWQNVKELLEVDSFPFKTVVVDSISKLDSMVISHILEKETKKTISLASACGGYGAGYLAAQQVHRGFKSLMDRFQDRGVTVIYIAHLSLANVKLPDSEDYTAYTIVMNHDKSRECYIDDVDAVLLCRQKDMVVNSDSGRNLVKSMPERIIVTGMNSSHVSKNRFSMPETLPMNYEAISQYVNGYESAVKKDK